MSKRPKHTKKGKRIAHTAKKRKRIARAYISSHTAKNNVSTIFLMGHFQYSYLK